MGADEVEAAGMMRVAAAWAAEAQGAAELREIFEAASASNSRGAMIQSTPSVLESAFKVVEDRYG